MLRTTVAAFAAGVGGADAVTVLPFDARARRCPTPSAAGSPATPRSLLIAESHVAKVADPAGGVLRRREAHRRPRPGRGWAELGRIEAAGGIDAALDDGSLHARIDEVVAGRDGQIAHRKRPLTGLSEFPNLAETLPERAPHADGADAGPPLRRARSRRCATSPPHDPVFLATMGTRRRAHRPRHLRHQPVRRRRRRGRRRPARPTASTPSLAAYDGQAGGLPGRHRHGVRRVGRRPGRRAARGGRPLGDPGRQAGDGPRASTTPAPWASTPSTFLHRTREKLA